MENETQRRFESIYSSKVKAGRRRTYFFDVRKTKGDDYYVTLTESTKKFNGEGYERHKIFLYKEDFNRFLDSLGDVINHVKTELMPDYDYDEYTNRQKEWEEKRALEAQQEAIAGTQEEETVGAQEENADSQPEDTIDTHIEKIDIPDPVEETSVQDPSSDEGLDVPEDEEDMSW